MKSIKLLFSVSFICLVFQGCGFYKFNGISTDAQTFQVNYFQNEAAIVEPGIERTFTLALQDLIQDQSSLSLVSNGGEVLYEGEIVEYYIAPQASTSNNTAAQNRLTIAVNVRYYNNNRQDGEDDFERRFSFFSDVGAATQLTGSALDTALEEIFERITQDIVNASFSTMVMNTKTLTYLLEHPDHITAVQTSDMRAVIDEFPYFQSAQAIYLKGLKNQESFTYNGALKRTAAATADRSVLFDYITSEVFNQNDISEQIKVQEQTLRGLTIQDLQDVSNQVQTEELAKASQILDPGLFVEKKDSEMTAERPEEILQLGKPLNFNTNETHSFGEWLRFAAFKPIDRSKSGTPATPLSETVEKETEVQVESLAISRNKVTQKSMLSNVEVRKRKQQIIDSFIEMNPKINVAPKATSQKKNISQEPLIPSDVLMTETLARVYIEQNNFKKAKQAYRILSLKYPEKSGFFADQIRAIEQLEEK